MEAPTTFGIQTSVESVRRTCSRIPFRYEAVTFRIEAIRNRD